MSAAEGPRAAASACLRAVDEGGAYANLAMPGILRSHGLSGPDAAFAVELAYGALRMRRLYDAVASAASGRSPEQIDPPVRRALWLGIHQLLALRVPAHAAVSETVDLVRREAGPRATGFANAVLRKVSSRDREAWLARVAPGDGLEDLALRHSHPDWVARELDAALLADGRAGELEALLLADNAPAPVTLCARPGLAGSDELLAAAPGSSTTAWSPYGVSLAHGDPGSIPAVREGRAAVQDEGSQVVAAALAQAPLDGPDAQWLDMCSGPGGKAGLLGALAAQRGAVVDALEIHPHRAELVRKAVRALPPGTVSVHVDDARAWRGGPYDRILLDAPCTGLGALRRRPEARWRRAEDDLPVLAELQGSLLRAAGGLLRPGGVLAYVTCSPVVAETRDVVARAVSESGGALRVLDARAGSSTVAGSAPDSWGTGPYAQWWPHVHGTDAMFLALLQRDGAAGPPE